MTVSLPATLPTVAQAPGKSGTAPAKGLATAPGQHKAAAPGTEEAAGVADMFAALVAALTAQMQPVADGSVAVDATAGEAAVATPVAVPGEALPILGEVPADVALDPTAVIDGADVVEAAQPATPAVPAEDGGPAQPATPAVPGAKTNEVPGGEKGATPASPATPAVPGEEGEQAQRATPATPAVPVHGADRQAPAAATPVVDIAPSAEKAGAADVNPLAAAPSSPATAATERAAAVAPAPRAAAPDPHVQVARVVRPLSLGDDGAYELALDLTPAELGRVRIDVELRGSTIHLSLRADNAATRELLSSSLQQLRNELEAAGLNAGHLDVGQQGANSRGGADARQQHTPTSSADAAADVPADTAATTTTEDAAGDNGLNVLA